MGGRSQGVEWPALRHPSSALFGRDSNYTECGTPASATRRDSLTIPKFGITGSVQRGFKFHWFPRNEKPIPRVPVLGGRVG